MESTSAGGIDIRASGPSSLNEVAERPGVRGEAAAAEAVAEAFPPATSRLPIVPIGQPRCRAASSQVRPSRSQSTIGTR